LGQPFVIENKPGAGGNIGMDAIAKATADGYTMGPATVANLSIAQFLYSKMAFDAEKDLSIISMHWELPNVVVTSNETPAKDMREFLEWARTRPRGVTYGSPGIGTTAHLSGSLFCNRNRLEGEHVPFRGASQAIPALLSGDLTFAIDNLASYVPVIQEGRLKAYAVTSAQRWERLPNIPTMAEAGIPDFVVTSWCTWVGPAGMPKAAIEKINATMRAISEDPAVKERFLQTGAKCSWSTPEAAAAFAASQRPMFREMVRISGARVD
jgi:tripartite-type tricarboxylate transporter receptor subunit TctC